MAATSDYAVAREADGSYRLDRTTPPHPGPVVRVKPVTDRRGQTAGWRLQPLVTVHGSKSRIWTSVAEAIAATRLMTLPQARRAVATADPLPSQSEIGGAP
jgi:hypothetical protein